jgi:type II restriction enzyme
MLVTFLEATALGMVPNKAWNKTFDADGGILVIKKNGEIVSFYREDTESKDELLEYLSENTLLETPSKT